jgi:hypothetical protein
VGELVVDRRIGLVAPGGDVEIVQADRVVAVADGNGLMTGVGLAAESPDRRIEKRSLRGNGDAVVAGLAVDEDMGVAALMEDIEREAFGRALDLLQAEEVRALAVEEVRDQTDARTDRVDVPGGDGERHGDGDPGGRRESGEQ